MNIVIVSPNRLLTLRGSEHFVLETCRRFSYHPSVKTQVVTFRRRYATEDLARLDEGELRSRLRTVYHSITPGSWSEFNWVSPKVFRKNPILDELNRRMEVVPPGRKLTQILRSADRIYFVTWSMEDLLAFLPVAFFAGRKHVVAGIHSRMPVRGSDRAILSLWARLGVLRGVHTLDSQSTRVLRRLPVTVIQIQNEIDCEMFRPGEKSRDRFVVLFAGSASLAKGADLLPRIYGSLVEKQMQGFTMWICSSETGKLGKEIAEWCKGKENVVFKGWASRTELAAFYRQASVLLMPSRREVQPLANLEAQASGTPVIASDLPSFRENIKDGETGFLVHEFEVEAFAQRIMELYSMWLRGAPYEKMCTDARRYVSENFASPIGSDKLLRMLINA